MLEYKCLFLLILHNFSYFCCGQKWSGYKRPGHKWHVMHANASTQAILSLGMLLLHTLFFISGLSGM